MSRSGRRHAAETEVVAAAAVHGRHAQPAVQAEPLRLSRREAHLSAREETPAPRAREEARAPQRHSTQVQTQAEVQPEREVVPVKREELTHHNRHARTAESAPADAPAKQGEASAKDFVDAASRRTTGKPAAVTAKAMRASSAKPVELATVTAHPALPQSIVIRQAPAAPSAGALARAAEQPRATASVEPASADAPADDYPGSTAQPTSTVSIIRRAGNDRPELPDTTTAALIPDVLPDLYNARGRLVMPPALKGSHEILIHQNQMADEEGLQRILDDDDLLAARAKHLLVALPESDTLRVDDRLPENRRYARPWTAAFLATLARAHYQRFHTPLQVNSAVRTVAFQQKLIRTNGNAAPFEGDTASPHLTGQAVDLAKKGLSTTEIAWMRGYLLPLIQQGKIDVEEEFQQACFHISVYRKYVPGNLPPRQIVTTHREGVAPLASALNR